jgi:hypothetical protein
MFTSPRPVIGRQEATATEQRDAKERDAKERDAKDRDGKDRDGKLGATSTEKLHKVRFSIVSLNSILTRRPTLHTLIDRRVTTRTRNRAWPARPT